MKFRLLRQDDNGNVFLVQESENIGPVAERMSKFEGHKQTHWIEEVKVVPGIYKHFKGQLYEVPLGTADEPEENGLRIVVYRPLYGDYGLKWRYEDKFTEWVVRDRYSGPRYKLVKEF